MPLFVEELTKMLLDSELLREDATHYELTGPLLSVAIPDTLQDSLMARLDQMNAAKEVAQLGAVLGREFAYDVLPAVVPLDEAALQAGLAQLVEAELLYQRGRPPRAKYMFKHALIWLACGKAKANATKPMSCPPQFTPGSPKTLTRQIFRRQRCYLQSWPHEKTWSVPSQRNGRCSALTWPIKRD